MGDTALVKVNVETAAEICVRLDLAKESRLLLRDTMAPREFVEALAADKQYLPAIDFVAHALPAREAIWWGCLCLQHACGNRLTPLEKTACTAAVQWVLQPTEANRAAAKPFADTVGMSSPAGALAVATHQSGGSLAPFNLPPIPPGEFAPARAVAIAVKLASTQFEAAKVIEAQRSFVELGIGIAEGLFM